MQGFVDAQVRCKGTSNFYTVVAVGLSMFCPGVAIKLSTNEFLVKNCCLPSQMVTEIQVNFCLNLVAFHNIQSNKVRRIFNICNEDESL